MGILGLQPEVPQVPQGPVGQILTHEGDIPAYLGSFFLFAGTKAAARGRPPKSEKRAKKKSEETTALTAGPFVR